MFLNMVNYDYLNSPTQIMQTLDVLANYYLKILLYYEFHSTIFISSN